MNSGWFDKYRRLLAAILAIAVLIAAFYVLYNARLVTNRIAQEQSRINTDLSRLLVTSEVYMALLFLFGLGLLVLILFVVAILFQWAGLASKSQAFGLPRGSISAVLALSFVMLFALLSVYFYSDLSSQQRSSRIAGLTKASLNSIPIETIESSVKRGNGTYTVYIRPQKSQSSIDFSKQVMTIVSTLMSAIAGFYFGAKATNARKPKTPPNPPNDPPNDPPNSSSPKGSRVRVELPESARTSRGAADG